MNLLIFSFRLSEEVLKKVMLLKIMELITSQVQGWGQVQLNFHDSRDLGNVDLIYVFWNVKEPRTTIRIFKFSRFCEQLVCDL